MAAVRWLVMGGCSLGALAFAAVGVGHGVELRSSESTVMVAPKVALRPWPNAFVAAVAPPAPQVPHVAAPEASAPAPEAAHAVEAAAAPPAVPVVTAQPVTTGVDGVLFLRATETADVFVDGKRVGSAPVLGLKAKLGPHKVRFDCYDAAGNTVAGAVQNVIATAEKPVDITFACPPSE